VRYIKHLLEQFDDDVVLALAAYNAGSRHVRRYKGVPPFPTTRMYIKKVLKFRNEFEAQLASPNPLPSAS
jgi:soluble lytic murein transglycosylase-like protein